MSWYESIFSSGNEDSSSFVLRYTYQNSKGLWRGEVPDVQRIRELFSCILLPRNWSSREPLSPMAKCKKKNQDLHYFQNNFQFYNSNIDSFAKTSHHPCSGVLLHAGVAIFIDLIDFKNLHGKDDLVRISLADRVLKTGTMSVFSTSSPSVLILIDKQARCQKGNHVFLGLYIKGRSRVQLHNFQKAKRGWSKHMRLGTDNWSCQKVLTAEFNYLDMKTLTFRPRGNKISKLITLTLIIGFKGFKMKFLVFISKANGI